MLLRLCRFVFSSAAIDAAGASSPAAQSFQLTLVASRFAVNGTWLGFANVTSSQLQLCSGPQAGAGAWLAFGQNYRSASAFQQLPFSSQQLQLCLPLLSKEGPIYMVLFATLHAALKGQSCCFLSHCKNWLLPWHMSHMLC